jgi:hypothetical protein
LGQAAIQSPQPLHRSVSILIKPFFKKILPYFSGANKNNYAFYFRLSMEFTASSSIGCPCPATDRFAEA